MYFRLFKVKRVRYFFGFTLIELLIVLSIIAVLTSLAIPSLNAYTSKADADSTIQLIRKHIYLTRQLAIARAEIVTMCPIDTNGCGSDWNSGYAIFSDRNNNRQIDNDDQLIESVELELNGGSLSWRASGGRNHLSFSSNGNARQFGRFHLCDRDANPSYSRALVINRQGKIRMYRDRNRDGIVEDIDGAVPRCGI